MCLETHKWNWFYVLMYLQTQQKFAKRACIIECWKCISYFPPWSTSHVIHEPHTSGVSLPITQQDEDNSCECLHWIISHCDARWTNSHWMQHCPCFLKPTTNILGKSSLFSNITIWKWELGGVVWLHGTLDDAFLGTFTLKNLLTGSKHSHCLHQELPAIIDAPSPWLPAGVFKGQTSIRFSQGAGCVHHHPDLHLIYSACREEPDHSQRHIHISGLW